MNSVFRGRRSHSFRGAAISLLLGTHLLACGATSVYVSADLQLDFPASAVALDSTFRSRLAETVDQVRSWCGFQVAVVTGHADSSERAPSSPIELSTARAEYVGQLLSALGIPKDRIYSEGKGASQPIPPWSGRVNIYFKGEGIGDQGCTIPLNARGFRVRG
jgi:hypothetical protein